MKNTNNNTTNNNNTEEKKMKKEMKREILSNKQFDKIQKDIEDLAKARSIITKKINELNRKTKASYQKRQEKTTKTPKSIPGFPNFDLPIYKYYDKYGNLIKTGLKPECNWEYLEKWTERIQSKIDELDYTYCEFHHLIDNPRENLLGLVLMPTCIYDHMFLFKKDDRLFAVVYPGRWNKIVDLGQKYDPSKSNLDNCLAYTKFVYEHIMSEYNKIKF